MYISPTKKPNTFSMKSKTTSYSLFTIFLIIPNLPPEAALISAFLLISASISSSSKCSAPYQTTEAKPAKAAMIQPAKAPLALVVQP